MANVKRDGTEGIIIDLDADRIRDIVDVAYTFCTEFLQIPSLNRGREDIMGELNAVLGSHRVSLPFFLDFSSKRMNDFQLRVDPRRKEVLGISKRFPTLKNGINAFLRNL